MANSPTSSSPLHDLPVLLSASIPESLAQTPRAQGVYNMAVMLVEALLAAGARLLFGGHPTITPLVHRAAKRLGTPAGRISLYQVPYFRDQLPTQAWDTEVFGAIHWVGEPGTDLAEQLTALRKTMARAARAAIFVGGKTTGFHGNLPGIQDEYQRFRTSHPDAPIYLVGALGGETGRLIAEGVEEHNTLSKAQQALVHTSEEESIVAHLIVADLAAKA